MADILEAMFEVNRQKLEEIQQYCDSGGLDRMVETAPLFYKIMDEQLRLLDLIQRRHKQEKMPKIRCRGN